MIKDYVSISRFMIVIVLLLFLKLSKFFMSLLTASLLGKVGQYDKEVERQFFVGTVSSLVPY